MHEVSQLAIFGSAHSGEAFDSATCDPQYVAVQERIVQLYQTSALQQQAVYQIVTDVTRSVEGETEPEDFDATHFVQKLIETLLVHGACVWRPGSSSVQTPEILDPMSFYVEQRRSKYVPRKIPSVYRNTARLGNKWHLVLLETPLTEFDPRVKKWITRAPRSCAARAVKCSLAIEELQLHRRQRNLHNSQPTVFLHDTVQTTSQAANSWVDMYAKSADAHKAYGDGPRLAVGATNKPQQPTAGTFTTRTNALTAAPNARTVADRMQNFISAQADITASVRNALTTAPLKVGHTPGEVVDPFRDGRPAHAEMVLAEGSNHTLMRHLEGDSQEAVVQRDLTYGLLDAYHVPPGKFGLNRNTERMAGNLLISQQPIETYDLFIKKLIDYVNIVLEVAGSKLRYSQMISRAELDAVGGLLTVKAAKRLYSRAFKISEDDLDETKLVEMNSTNADEHVKKSTEQLAAERLKAK